MKNMGQDEVSEINIPYPIVDTGEEIFYNSNGSEISIPSRDNVFYGQDAGYKGYQPNYTDNEDGTVTDNITGLMWQQSPDLNGDGVINVDDKLSYEDALAGADQFNLGGYNDWRLPSIRNNIHLLCFTD